MVRLNKTKIFDGEGAFSLHEVDEFTPDRETQKMLDALTEQEIENLIEKDEIEYE